MLKSTPAREPADRQHLTRLQALGRELESAISAIEHNDLRQLQVAIANQERICNELAMKKWTPIPTEKQGAARALAATSKTEEQIRAAYVSLASLNRVYAGVVRRSRRTVALLSALYGSLGDGYSQEPARSQEFQTLSCEV